MQITKFIPKTITRTTSRQILLAKKHSPHAMFAAGVVGVIGGTVLACRATLKLPDIVQEVADEVDGVKTMKMDSPEYRRDLAYAYGHGAVRVTKLYAPAVIVGSVSIAALTGSHVTLSRRNGALTAAYAGLQHAYDEYRIRVREEVGEAKEADIYHAATVEKVKGSPDLTVVDPDNLSPYARIFDEYNPNWEKDAELNRLFITCQQTWLNQKFQARGHVFLNEVYDALGFQRTPAGQVVGWVLGESGDNYIDFGLYEAVTARFMSGAERSCILDFNVDGVVYDKI